MKEIKAIIQPFMLDKVLFALESDGTLPGVTVSQVMGWGQTKVSTGEDTIDEGGHAFAKKIKLEIVVPDDVADQVVETITDIAHTGQYGDGKIFVYEVRDAIRISSGDHGDSAL